MVSESEDGRGARRVAKHRSALWHKGVKPGHIWVADTSSGETVAALELACQEINAADRASGNAGFAYALSEEE